MRALDPEAADAVWAAVEPLLPPVPVDEHPLGCHRPRVSERAVFDVILVRLVTGCSWVDAEHLCGNKVSDTTVRARRDEWITAGVFGLLTVEALAGYDRIIELDLSECAVDGSQHKAPCRGAGTGKNPTDGGRLGWKWSLFTDRNGIAVGWATDGANRHDTVLFEPTMAAMVERGLLADIETLHLDRGYDSSAVRELCTGVGIAEVVGARQRRPGEPKPKKKLTLGMRWPVERTNSWLSNFGQMRRNTDRRVDHRLAQLSLAVVLPITAKLIDWRDRWCPA
jgi:transposase